MKKFLHNLRQTAIAGFFFLFPLYVTFIVVTKAWSSLSSMGSKLAGMFGVKSVLGFGGTTVFSALLIVAIWFLCGLLVRFSLVGRLSNRLEDFIASLVPGYASYRATAEEKLQHKTRTLPYTSALLKQADGWQPAFVIEHDDEKAIVFLPDAPETNRGRVLIAEIHQVQFVPSLTANELDASLKQMGKGLLNRCGIGQKQV